MVHQQVLLALLIEMAGQTAVYFCSGFTIVTRCSKDTPQVVIMDGHASHKSLEVVIYGRDNGGRR